MSNAEGQHKGFGFSIGGVRIDISKQGKGFQKGKLFVSSRPKKDALNDNKKLYFPPDVLTSLKQILPDAFQLTGEDEEIERIKRLQEARYTPNEACTMLIAANKGKEVTPRRVAEYLVHTTLSFQRENRFKNIDPDAEEGWISDINTALVDIWPRESQVSAFMNKHAGR